MKISLHFNRSETSTAAGEMFLLEVFLIGRFFLFMMFRLHIIGFLLLVTTMLLGCAVLFNRVVRLDPIILKADDLPMMRLTSTRRSDSPTEGASGPVGFHQQWDGRQLIVRYYLFGSSSAAKVGAATGGTWRVASPPDSHPERNPENIIGDATWHYPPRREDPDTDMAFVKNNVLVHITASGHPSYRLQFVRDVARKIEAKIEAILPKK